MLQDARDVLSKASGNVYARFMFAAEILWAISLVVPENEYTDSFYWIIKAMRQDFGWWLAAVSLTVAFAILAEAVKMKRHERNIRSDLDMWATKHHFAVLAIQGYSLSPNGFDNWANNCDGFIKAVFGSESYEIGVLNKTRTDDNVNLSVAALKARIELLRGVKLRHPNEVLREDSPVLHILAVLEWSESRFTHNHPLTTL